MPARRAQVLLVVPAVLAGAILVSFPATTCAQWVQTDGPRGGLVRSLATVPDGSGGTRLYAGQIRVWRTDDAGSSWTFLDEGLSDPNAFSLLPVSDGAGGTDLFLGTNGGVFHSTDDGATWSPRNTGLTNLSIYALASGPNGSGGRNLYAGAFLGDFFRSTDDGAHWTGIGAGFPSGFHVNALTVTGTGAVLAATMNGIYRSTDFGATWTRVFTLYGFAFARNGTTLYAGTSNGVYRSTNDGATWSPINAGLTFSWIYSVAAIPNGTGVTLFAGAGGVLRSTDNGSTWTPASNGLVGFAVHALTTAPNGAGGTDLYAGTSRGVFRSSDLGTTWTDVSFIFSGVPALEVTPGGTVLAATENAIYRSTDLGTTWADVGANTTGLDFAVNPDGAGGPILFLGGAPVGVYKSVDDGLTWNPSSDNLGDMDVNSVAVVPNGAGGTNVLAGTYSELYVSTNDGALWQPANLQTLTLDYAVAPDGAGGHRIYTCGFGGVWVSTNGGTAWDGASGGPAGVEGQIVQGIAVTQEGANVFAAGDPFGAFRSTNGGASWTAVNTGIGDLRLVTLLSPDGTNLFAGGAGGVYLSTDQGDHWTPVGDGLTTGVRSLSLSADGTTLLAGTSSFGVWRRPLAEMLPTVDVPIAPGSGLTLRSAHPNPFTARTTIQYALPRTTAVRLAVFDVRGRFVRSLAEGSQEAGTRSASWDGTDARGARVAPGIYLLRLEADRASVTRKLSVLN